MTLKHFNFTVNVEKAPQGGRNAGRFSLKKIALGGKDA